MNVACRYEWTMTESSWMNIPEDRYEHTVKLRLLNTPPLWTICLTEHPQDSPSVFCWFWTPPIWNPLHSECERILMIPIVCLNFGIVNSDRGYHINERSNWRCNCNSHYHEFDSFQKCYNENRERRIKSIKREKQQTHTFIIFNICQLNMTARNK